MIRVSVFYPNQAGATFDWAYYESTHLPLVRARLGAALRSLTYDVGLGGGGPGDPAPFTAIAQLEFDSVPAFQAAFGPHAAEIVADIANYSSLAPTIQVSEIRPVA